MSVVIDNLDRLFADYKRWRDSLPPASQASYDRILGRVISQLGESPEAWRGMAVLATEQLTGLCALYDHDDDVHVGDIASVAVGLGLLCTPMGAQALMAHIEHMAGEL